jgi:hypothetical protein
MPRPGNIKAKVLAAINAGRCNTSVDVSEETGLSIPQCAKAVNYLVAKGVVRRNGRVIRGEYRNHATKVFEVVA